MRQIDSHMTEYTIELVDAWQNSSHDEPSVESFWVCVFP